MVDEHGVAVEVEIPRFDHLARGRGAHRRAFGGGDVHAAVGPARLAVEDAAQAEGAAHGPVHRGDEGGVHGGVAPVAEGGADAFAFDTDAAQGGLVRVHHAFVLDGEALGGVGLGADLEGDTAPDAPFAHADVVSAGFDVQADAHHCLPAPVPPAYPQAPVSQMGRGSRSVGGAQVEDGDATGHGGRAG